MVDPQKIFDAACRQHFAMFVELAYRTLYPEALYLPNWHIEVIAHRIDQLRIGGIMRLLLCLPPRHLKSFIGSICFPAFLLGHDPTCKIVCISYSQDLADSFAHQTRRLMESAAYKRMFPKTRLDPLRKSKVELGTTRNGFRRATSVTGTLTGKGGDYLILDDLIKADDAASEVIRESVNDWFDNTLSSRLDQPKSGRILVIGQRLHEDDLPGRLIERGGWNELIMPLVAPHDLTFELPCSTIHVPAGELLHEERIDKANAAQIHAEIGTSIFEAQYNQRPIPAGGYLFKLEWLRYAESAVDPTLCDWVVQSWDTALQTDERNDFTVCATIGKIGQNYHILDIMQQKLTFPQQVQLLPEMRKKWKADLVIVEESHGGSALASVIRNDNYVPWLVTKHPRIGKVARAEKQSVKFERNRVWLPRSAAWRPAFEKELAAFPKGKHDDQVDAIVQFLASTDMATFHNQLAVARSEA